MRWTLEPSLVEVRKLVTKISGETYFRQREPGRSWDPEWVAKEVGRGVTDTL